VLWYATLGEDSRATYQNDLQLYGGFFELVVQAMRPLSGLEVFDNRHLVNALFGFVGFVAAWGLGRHLGGPIAGFLSALLLALTPSFYGHAFANPKDLPFASLYALAAWMALRGSEHVTRLGWREIVPTGIAIGLAAGVRVAGIVLFGYAAALWFGCLWLSQGEASSPSGRAPARARLRVALACLGTLILGWTVMVAVWPWAQLDPLRNPWRGLTRITNFYETLGVLHAGALLTSGTIPRTYIPEWLALTLPEFYFLALALGLVTVIIRFPDRRRGPAAWRRPFQILWLAALAGAPVLWVVVRHTPLYNGYRHLLFVVPSLAVLAGLAIAGFFSTRIPRAGKAAAAVALAASLALTVVDMVQLHPYQYVYFNRLFAGGLARAADKYDTDYWGASYGEAIAWVVRHYSGQDLREKVRVTGESGHALQRYLTQTEERRRRFQHVRFEEDPHVVLARGNYRQYGDEVPGRLIHVVMRQGAPLLYVFEARAPR
jgi:Dolichyl-phosphate-mannose-protein mannosyltransferase